MANREGILGCIGYVSIYLISQWLGRQVLGNTNTNHNKVGSQTFDGDGTTGTTTITTTNTTPAVGKLAWASMMVILLWRLMVHVAKIPVSRRSTNLPFVLWTLVVNLPLATCILFIYERHGQQVTYMAQLITKYGLLCFIVANLLTGIVNLSINTLQIHDFVAMGILVVYMTTVSILTILLDTLMTWIGKNRSKRKQA
jgi:phosphatidylinositol glycan class W